MDSFLLTLGKACFLLIVIGFFLPIAYDLNGFQIAQSDIASKLLTFALYGLFVSAIIGSLFFVLHIVDIIFMPDWLDNLSDISKAVIFNSILISFCLACGLIPFFMNLKEHSGNYQIGAILIIIGCPLILIFHILLFLRIKKESRNSGYSGIDFSNDYERDPRDICP